MYLFQCVAQCTYSIKVEISSRDNVTSRYPEVRALQDSVKQLAEQMTTLMDRLHEHTITAAVQHPAPAPVRCYNCNRTGHLLQNCRQPRRQPVCYTCIQLGHVARNRQHQGNGLGMTTSRATGRPAHV